MFYIIILLLFYEKFKFKILGAGFEYVDKIN